MRKYQLQKRQAEAEVGAESEIVSEDKRKPDAVSRSHEDPDQAASA